MRPRKSERGKRNALNCGYEWFTAVERAVCFKSGFPILRLRFTKKSFIVLEKFNFRSRRRLRAVDLFDGLVCSRVVKTVT